MRQDDALLLRTRSLSSDRFMAASHAARSAVPLEDNRPQTVAQRKLWSSHTTAPVQRKANSTGLPDQLKSGIENLSGYAMDDVKVHYNSSQPAQLQAHAFAQGTNIHLAPGQEKHLPHEAWHVVQQKQGRVKPTMQLKSKVNVNDDISLESEADMMGAKAMKLPTSEPGPLKQHAASTTQFVLQAKWILRAGQLVQVADDYVLQSGEQDFDMSHFLHRPRVIFDKGKSIGHYDASGKLVKSDFKGTIATHPQLQAARGKQGETLGQRLLNSPDLDSELARLKSITEKLEKTAGPAVPKNHAEKIASLSKSKFSGADYRAVIKAQDELTQSEATTAFFDGLRKAMGSSPSAKQQQFFEMALRAFSSLRTATESVQAPIEDSGALTGQQHPTSHGQEKLPGGSSGHSYADRMRVQEQVGTFNDLAKDPAVSAVDLVIGNLLNALVTTLSTMSHPGEAENVPDFNVKRSSEQMDDRERMKSQTNLLEQEMLRVKKALAKQKRSAPFRPVDSAASPMRDDSASDLSPAMIASNVEIKNYIAKIAAMIEIRLKADADADDLAKLNAIKTKAASADTTTVEGTLALGGEVAGINHLFNDLAPGFNRQLTPGGGHPLGPGGYHLPVLEQYFHECGQMAVHNVLSLEETAMANDFAHLNDQLHHQGQLESYGHFQNDIDEDAIRQMIHQAGHAGIPVIGNLGQLQTFIADYNQAELLGSALFHTPGYGRALLQTQWGVTDIEIAEINRMNQFLSGARNSINFIVNTDAHLPIAAGYHWITLRIVRQHDGQLRIFVLDSIQGTVDYTHLITEIRNFIAANAH